jgi:hypothetical protein
MKERLLFAGSKILSYAVALVLVQTVRSRRPAHPLRLHQLLRVALASPLEASFRTLRTCSAARGSVLGVAKW